MTEPQHYAESAAGAVISPCEQYRYRLWRRWGPGEAMAWIMLNPSTADASVDDPTIRRCIGFAKREGYDAIEVLNLYAWRSTDPALLSDVYQVEGTDNARQWEDVLTRCDVGMIVAGWGAKRPKVQGEILRSKALEQWFTGGWFCLGTTKNGSPRHPLYVAGNAEMIPFRLAQFDG